MRRIETYIVDAFTEEAFKGNPAGVCFLDEALTSQEMQTIAMELGLSETAFLLQQKEDNKYSIRYFSPKMEIPLCGHATMASSKVIFEKDKTIKEINFININKLHIKTQKQDNEIVMEFPIYNTYPQDTPLELLEALGIESVKESVFNRETKILLLEIEDHEILRKLNPNYEHLKKSHDSINGVLVTASSGDSSYDFESRYFWPWSGTNEDPATGGTHTFLTKYWGDKLNKKKMRSFQCSPRTGYMEVELINDSKMTIKSNARIVLKGELMI